MNTGSPPRAGRSAALMIASLLACAARAQAPAVAFDWFEYSGHDAVFDSPLPPDHYRNPILAGFFPDPSVVRAAGRFYLVNSTFTYFPGIPVFESADLVHWQQIGNVIERPAQLSLQGLEVSRGLFAPSIRFHHGVFYLLDTAVDAGGNFLSIARNPSGPWSDPIWLPQLADGIDPSLFFDDDGHAYLLNNGPPPGEPRYQGHRAIWIQQFDSTARRLIGPRKVLVNGGVDFSRKPVWIEGPHLYKRRGWYYLMCAEGGTGTQHSEVVLRARSPWGPFHAYAGNPILTQRDLDPARPDAIADAGHADLVVGPDGRWWAVFLAVRTYNARHYNLGRETFLLPVSWRHGWPIILPRGQSIPYVVAGPPALEASATAAAASEPLSGNFTWRDEFEADALQPGWLQLRTPGRSWADLRTRPGWLTIHPQTAALDTFGSPSFLARRQQHMNFRASTALELPASAGVAAGLGVFQNEHAWYFLGVRRSGENLQVFLQRDRGHGAQVIASAFPAQSAPPAGVLKLQVAAEGRRYSFSYDVDGGGWRMLLGEDDAVFLSSDVAGGFVGTVLGPFARAE